MQRSFHRFRAAVIPPLSCSGHSTAFLQRLLGVTYSTALLTPFVRPSVCLNHITIRAWNQPLKWHYFCHVVDDIKVYRRNPRFNLCFSDEDFAGHMADIAAASHPSTLGARSLERWVGLLYVRIRELALQDHISARGGA